MQSAGIANIHRLNEVKLCDGDNHCTQPTQFSWHEGENSDPRLREDRTVYSGATKFINYQYIDVTADGKPEVCYYNLNGQVVCDDKASSIGKSFTYTRDVAGTLQFHDVNKDGYADYCLSSLHTIRRNRNGDDRTRGGEGTYCAMNQRNGTFARATQWADHSIDRDEREHISTQYLDINDDQYTDLCVQTSTDLTCWLNNQSDQFAQKRSFNVAFSHPKQSFFMDADGDGRKDICGLVSNNPTQNKNGFSCYINTTTGNTVSFASRQLWSGHHHFATANNHQSVIDSLRIADFNGDALPDVCYLRDDHLYCGINTGSRFASIEAVTGSPLSTDGGWGAEPTGDDAHNLLMVDINQDGHIDACTHYRDGSYHCAYNNGQGKLGRMQEYAQLDPMLDLYTLGGVNN